MINTSPPAAGMHPATSDHGSASQRIEAADLGPSPVDGIPAGQTRTNLDTAHAGNYAYTELPTKEGNSVDPHAGAPGTGVLGSISSAIPSDAGAYLQSAMAAVGLGGAAVAVEHHESDKNDKIDHEIEIRKKIPSGSDQNFLDGPLSAAGVKVSPHSVDEDVQEAVAAAGGTKPSDTPVQTTSNNMPKAEVATSPATAPLPAHADLEQKQIKTTTNELNKAEVATSPATTAAGAAERPPASGNPVPTTSNTMAKAPVSTSPATAVQGSQPTSNKGEKPKVDTAKAAAANTRATVESKLPGRKSGEHARDTSSTTSGSTNASPSKGHKRGASLKDKIKGEMKIFSGKLSHNQEKVEEGRALKSGGLSPQSPH